MENDSEDQTNTFLVTFDPDITYQFRVTVNRYNFDKVLDKRAQNIINMYFERTCFGGGHHYVFYTDTPLRFDDFPISDMHQDIHYSIREHIEINDWCKNNCEGGWYFVMLVMSDAIVFEKETDLVLFKLLHQ